jgi:hypothetical protein
VATVIVNRVVGIAKNARPVFAQAAQMIVVCVVVTFVANT